MSAMLPDDALVPSLRASRESNSDVASGTPWGDRWVDIEQSPVVARWVDIAQVNPQPNIERKVEPFITLRSVLLVLFAFALTLATIEVLVRRSIDER